MIYVRLIALPLSVRGVTSPNADGTYTVFINSRLSPEQQRKALAHETAHIQGNHFYDGSSLEQAEENANQAPALSEQDPWDPGFESPYIFARLSNVKSLPTKKHLEQLFQALSDFEPDDLSQKDS